MPNALAELGSLRRLVIIASTMALRRVVLLLLLLFVPLHAVAGATGYVCGHRAHHPGAYAAAIGDESAVPVDRAIDALRDRAASARTLHADAVDGSAVADAAVGAKQADSGTPDNKAVTCAFCGECSFSLAPGSEFMRNTATYAVPTNASSYVDPAALPHVGDALFRPPRSIQS